MRPIFSVAVCMLFACKLQAQIPVVYYDFEVNNTVSEPTNRNTKVETIPELAIAATSVVKFSRTNLAKISCANSGNAMSYGATSTNKGFAIGGFDFTTSTNSTASDPSFNFGPFSMVGYYGISLSLDARGDDSYSPKNIDIYWSTDNINFTKVTNVTDITTSYQTLTFSISTLTTGNAADNATQLYIKITGYKALQSYGVLRMDNLTLYAQKIVNTTSNTNLIDIIVHGKGLSAGGSFVPSYKNGTLNGSSTNKIFKTITNVPVNGTIKLQNSQLQISNTPH